jgi:hypothetical protein
VEILIKSSGGTGLLAGEPAGATLLIYFVISRNSGSED